MFPFHFGPPSRRLFGLMEIAAPEVSNGRAVLLCNPFGHEALRLHRVWRVLADRLARNGTDVLRFDYHGTGDSPGDDEDADLEGHAADVLAAHAELRRRSSASHVTWVGARLGAGMAVHAARRKPPQALLLWDPIVDGAQYVETLRHQHVWTLEQRYNVPDMRWRKRLATDPLYLSDEAIGFAISATLRQQLQAMTPASMAVPAGLPTCVLADPADLAVARWAERQAAGGAPLTSVPLAQRFSWGADPEGFDALVPLDVVNGLMQQLEPAHV